MQCFGLACLASARNLIIFVLFYLLPHRQFLLLLLLLLVLPLLLLVCLLLLLLRFPPPLCRFTACSPIPFLLFRPFLPSISTAWPKYFCLSIYTTYTKINVYIHELTSRTLCWPRPPCPPTPLSTTYLLLTACLVIVLVWPFVSKLLTMDVAK